MRRSPDSRWFAVKAAIEQPEHPIEAACWRHVRQLELSPSVDRALEIYDEEFERERLQPWILAGATNADIEARTGLSAEVVRVYKHLFFDVSAFRDMFEKQLWVERYDEIGTPTGKVFLQKAVLNGLEAVAHVMGAEVRLNPSEVLDSAMREAYFRSQALRYARLASPEAAAAHALLRTSGEYAQYMAQQRPPTAHDMLFKLKSRELTKNVEEVVPHGEILH